MVSSVSTASHMRRSETSLGVNLCGICQRCDFWVGKDATAVFNGGVYNHSNAAHNLLSTMRVGIIRGGMEVEVWKRAHAEGSIYAKGGRDASA